MIRDQTRRLAEFWPVAPRLAKTRVCPEIKALRLGKLLVFGIQPKKHKTVVCSHGCLDFLLVLRMVKAGHRSGSAGRRSRRCNIRRSEGRLWQSSGLRSRGRIDYSAGASGFRVILSLENEFRGLGGRIQATLGHVHSGCFHMASH